MEPAELVARLEAISRERPDRVLRLRGQMQQPPEVFELVVFRGFSSSTTHPTAFDPDQPVLPPGAVISQAELLAAPLDPDHEPHLRGPLPLEAFLDPEGWA